MPPEIVVLGIGNILLSDDGVGVRIMEALRTLHADLPSVTYIDGGTLSLSLATWFKQANSLLVLDAAELGTVPGTVRVISGSAMDLFNARPGRSVHEVGLRDLLAIGRLTDTLPARRALVTVQIQTIAWGLNLSVPVTQALPIAIQRAAEIITNWHLTT